MSIQMLPFKEWGKCLFDQSFTEEEPSGKAAEKSEDSEVKLYCISETVETFSPDNFSLHYHSEQNDYAIFSHVKEIHSPPPNIS